MADLIWRRFALFVHFFGIFFLDVAVSSFADEALQKFRGQVGGGNYSYYKLNLDGVFLLVLDTIEGDADLYVSPNHLYPTFDLDDHSMQSTTCGLDKVRISKDFLRPVGIGVYGHPSHEMSVYELQVYLDHDDEGKSNYYFSEEFHKLDSNQIDMGSLPAMAKDEEESILWTILVGILKVLLEILTT